RSARASLPRHDQLRAVFHAPRDVDVDVPRPLDDPLALAGVADLTWNLPRTAAPVARLAAQREAARRAAAAGAFALRTGLELGSRLGAGAVAGRTAIRGADGDPPVPAAIRLLQRDLDLVIEVPTRLWAAPEATEEAA